MASGTVPVHRHSQFTVAVPFGLSSQVDLLGCHTRKRVGVCLGSITTSISVLDDTLFLRNKSHLTQQQSWRLWIPSPHRSGALWDDGLGSTVRRGQPAKIWMNPMRPLLTPGREADFGPDRGTGSHTTHLHGLRQMCQTGSIHLSAEVRG